MSRVDELPEYNSWKMMKARCRRKTFTSYPDYGGRGIDYCERWEDFSNFLSDMGRRPPETSLDRIDNSRGYSPENCRWATRKQQRRNCRDNRLLSAFGMTRCLSEWAEILSDNKNTIRGRLRLGWSVNEALIGVKYAR